MFGSGCRGSEPITCDENPRSDDKDDNSVYSYENDGGRNVIRSVVNGSSGLIKMLNFIVFLIHSNSIIFKIIPKINQISAQKTNF